MTRLELVPYLLFVPVLSATWMFHFASSSQVHPNPGRPTYLRLKVYEFAGRLVGKCLYESSLGGAYKQLVRARFTRSFLGQIIGLRMHYKVKLPSLVWSLCWFEERLKAGVVEGDPESWLTVYVGFFLLFLPLPYLFFLSHSILKQMTQNSINPKFVSYWTMMWVKWIWSLLKRSIAKQDNWRRWGRQFLKVGQFNPFCLQQGRPRTVCPRKLSLLWAVAPCLGLFWLGIQVWGMLLTHVRCSPVFRWWNWWQEGLKYQWPMKTKSCI